MCKTFCCSRFLTHRGAIDPSITCDLDNEINPVFIPKNLSEEDYKRAAPAFRLASKALMTDAATKYLVTMADGDIYQGISTKKRLLKVVKLEWQAIDEYERDIRERTDVQPWVTILKYPNAQHTQEVNDVMRKRAQQLITNMASMTDITFGDDFQSNGNTRRNEGPLPAHLIEHFPRGTRSSIRVHNRHFEDLEDVSHPELHQWKLADILLHEFAHAFQNAVNGARLWEECYYGNAPCAEAGFDFTALIWGGVLKDCESIFHHCDREWTDDLPPRIVDGDISAVVIPWLESWPSQVIQAAYQRKNTSMFGARCSWPVPVTRITALKSSYVQSLFTKAFWGKGRYSAAVLTSRNSPFWYTGYTTVKPYGKVVNVHKLWSPDDPVVQKRCGKAMTEAADWRPASQRREDPLDILEIVSGMWPEQESDSSVENRCDVM